MFWETSTDGAIEKSTLLLEIGLLNVIVIVG
jgi:hypothetical protein